MRTVLTKPGPAHLSPASTYDIVIECNTNMAVLNWLARLLCRADQQSQARHFSSLGRLWMTKLGGRQEGVVGRVMGLQARWSEGNGSWE